MRNKLLLALFISMLALVAGYVLSNSYEFDLCYSDLESRTFDVSCNQTLGRIGTPLFYGFGALAIVFLVLLSAQQAIPAWKKFAKWFIPLAALVFIFYSEPGSGNYFAPYPEQVFKWLSGLYVVISFWIIGRVVLNQKNVSN